MQRSFESRVSARLYWLAAFLIATIYVVVNLAMGTAFPTPWPDEAHFLWQAHAFAEESTLFAEELNTERIIMWMPPGYMVITGLLFKLTGTSLQAARLFSLAAMLLAFFLLVRYLSVHGHRWIALVLTGLFFLNSRFLACGNIARMEALLLAVVLGGFLLIQRRHHMLGVALLAVAPLIHFNGGYFLLFGVLYVVIRCPRRDLKLQWNRWTIAALTAVAMAWAGYVLLAVFNWESFIQDMGFQFTRKGTVDFWSEITSLHYVIEVAVMLSCWAYAYWHRLKVVELLFLIIPAWLIWPIGHELWYQVIQHLGYLGISILTMHVVMHFALNVTRANGSWWRSTVMVVFLVVVIGWNYRYERIEAMWQYPQSADLVTMDACAEIPYFTPRDRATIADFVMQLSRECGGLEVEFQPNADEFLILDLEHHGVRFVCPLFERRWPDLVVVHDSRHLPDWWKFGKGQLARGGLTLDSLDHVWHSRDSTERWYFVALSEAVRASATYRSRFNGHR